MTGQPNITKNNHAHIKHVFSERTVIRLLGLLCLLAFICLSIDAIFYTVMLSKLDVAYKWEQTIAGDIAIILLAATVFITSCALSVKHRSKAPIFIGLMCALIIAENVYFLQISFGLPAMGLSLFALLLYHHKKPNESPKNQ